MIVYHPLSFWKDKKILLGVTGGIAAFKAVSLASYLVKAGAIVTVCMTQHAQKLVGKSTFEAITGRRVYDDLFEGEGNIVHISLARENQCIVIVPATANIVGKVANGIADDLLSTLVLVAPRQVVVAPAMNVDMWRNPIVQENIKRIEEKGMQVIPPDSGILACGEVGTGRLKEVEDLVEEIFYRLYVPKKLCRKRVLVTAGATREWLDAVRFISNPSSGLMGCALASMARALGGEVKVIMASSSVRFPSGIAVERVETVSEMQEALKRAFPSCDILLMNAAVSDFQCPTPFPSKIKKEGRESFSLSLVPAPDLLSSITPHKGEKIVVGFCAETEDLLNEARRKLKNKNLDMIVANRITKGESGFETPTSQAWVVDRKGNEIEFPLLDKRDLAEEILVHLVRTFFE